MNEPRVLVAEDEEHIARLIAFKLGRDGFSVAHAKDGGEALTLLPTQSWALVILDVMMPVHDGWKVLETLRSGAEASAIPVLMLTARGDAKAQEQASTLGATYFMKKPFDPEELSRTVRGLIQGGGGGAGWNADPELAALREEFIRSLPARKAALIDGLSRLHGSPVPKDLEAAERVAHSLAGTAETFGFARLGEVAGEWEDCIAAGKVTLQRNEPWDSRKALVQGEALARLLDEAIAK